MRNSKVKSTVAHLCQYGMKTKGKDGEWKPVRKATRFMSSSEAVLKKLQKRCNRDHEHQHLTGGRAKAAAIYPPMLCRAILRGIEEQRRREGVVIPRHVKEMTDKGRAIYNLMPENEEKLELTGEAENEKLEHEQNALKKIVYQPYPAQWKTTGENQIYDELTGEPLPMNLVKKARKEEIDFMLNW